MILTFSLTTAASSYEQQILPCSSMSGSGSSKVCIEAYTAQDHAHTLYSTDRHLDTAAG